ncbi:signal peptidase II [bacterium]|nr:MAG: signal peptidase II [bacterium]
MIPAKKNLFIIAACVLVDLSSKHFASQAIENPGLAFGIQAPGFFSLGLTAVLLAAFLVLYKKYFYRKNSVDWGFSLIVGGAVSNIIDRIPDLKVTDFIGMGLNSMNLA